MTSFIDGFSPQNGQVKVFEHQHGLFQTESSKITGFKNQDTTKSGQSFNITGQNLV